MDKSWRRAKNGNFPSIAAKNVTFMTSITKVYAPKQHNFLQDFVLLTCILLLMAYNVNNFPIY
jgi:hypothetical protein